MSLRTNKRAILTAVTIISIVTMACSISRPVPPPQKIAATATPAPTATPNLPPLPPVLVTRAPDRGEEQPVTSPIVLTFNQPMDRVSVESAFKVQPAVQGALRWDDDKTVRFVPAGDGFARDANYEVQVSESAKAQNGLALQMPINFRFKAIGFLEVSQVLPQKDTQDVASDSAITVMFNRPVVPLVAVSDQSKLPQPLTLDPPAKGRGEWLNTSIYVFHPDGLTPGVTYTAQVAAGLQDVSGAVLQRDFTWSFSVQPPQVVMTLPVDRELYVGLTIPISVTFNQPMDHASTEAAFSLRVGGPTGEKVSGTFQWITSTLGFAPSRKLDLDKTYYASVAAGAKSAVGQAGTRKEYAWTFQSVPYPRVVSTKPSDGDKNADPSGSIEIVFSAPIDPATVMKNVTITPTPKATDVYTYYNRSDLRFIIQFDRQPSTEYTVVVGGGITDPYSNPLGRDTTVKFTTRALDPAVYLNVPGQIGTYSAYTDTKLFAVYRNIATMDFELSRMGLDDFARVTAQNGWQVWQNYRPAPGTVLRQWSTPAAKDVTLNETAFFKAYAAEDGKSLKPGLYYLEVSSPQVGKRDQGGPSRHIMIVGTANVTFKMGEREALVWATDMQSGQPAPNAAVSLYDQDFKQFAAGKTDKDGLFVAQWDTPREMYTTMYAIVGEQGSDVFGLALNQWSDGIGPWDFGVDARYYSDPYNLYFTTDRPIYRPGQTVFFKAILRLDDDARYSLFKGADKLPVAVQDPQGKEVYSGTLPVSADMATLNGQFKLDDQAALGYYRLYTTLDATPSQQKDGGGRQYGIGFLVAAYVRPEFLVNVTTDKPAYLQGDQIHVDVQSSYYFGGPVPDAKVDWNVVSSPYYFEYKGQGYYDWTDTDNFYSREQIGGGGVIASGSGKTDSTGHFVTSVKADLGKNDFSQKFSIEGNVTDINDRVVANRTETIVHQGAFYIGLQPERYVAQVGDKASVNVKTVDWDSNDFGQQNLTVTFYKRDWYNVQEQTSGGPVWTVTFSDTAVATQTVTTDAKGAALASFTPQDGGTYRVVATGKDSQGNQVRSGTYLWVTSSEYVSWRQENNDRIQLVADQRSYAPGETASVLIPSPFQGNVTALVTVERGRILSKQVITLKSNSELLKIPVTADMAPNAYVSVVLVKGVDRTTPIAAFKVGYASFAVSTVQQELKVSITTDRDPKTQHYEPGDTVTYTIQATDYAGKPMQAELSLAVVDLSVLSLTDPNAPPIVDGFYGKRGLGIRTASTLVLSVDRLNIKLQTEVKGGGGGAGAGAGEFAPRQQFYDTAYWSATTRTDANGKAQVQVVLPDNLTTWRMTAKAVTANTLVGESTQDIISTKDLLIRPVTPRFFVVGDKSTVAAVVNNNTSNALNVEVRLEGEGVSITGQGSQQLTLPANDQVRVEWQVEAQDKDSANLVFSVSGGGLSDASKPPVGLPPDQRLPIYRYSTPETVATAGTLDQAGDRLEVVALPADAKLDTTQGDLTVRIDPSLAAGMTDGLTWLEHYPYECAEQTVSRFLPNVLTFRALKKLNLTSPELEDNLRTQVSIALQRLYGQQHADGGWGWWVNDKSNATTTAWAALGMLKANENGFAADATSLKRALDYLDAQLVSPTTLQESSQANMQAFILYVSAEAGRNNLSRAVALFDGKRDLLDNYGKAYLALALGIWQKGDRARIDPLLSDLNNAVITSATGAHWEEKTNDWFNWNTDTRSTAIILDLLARFDAQNALAPNVVRWLMVARTAGHWETTQETAWALIALTDWMDATGELKADYSWKVELNTVALGDGVANRDTVKQSTTLVRAVADLLRDQGNALVISRSTGSNQTGDGRLYYSAYLETYTPVEDVRSLSRGLVVARQYFRTDDPCLKDPKMTCTSVTSAQVGDMLQVKLSIVAPNDLYYVVVQDPLPAGAEAVDTSLKTTTQIGQAPQLSRANPDDPFGGYDGWGWWWFSHTEMRDEKVVLFATRLPKGAYEYTYMIRAGLAGTFKVLPSVGNEMYFPEVFGRSDGMVFTINK